MVLPLPGLCDVVPSLLPLGTVVLVWLAAASATAAVPSPATAKLPTAITVVKRAARCFPLLRVPMACSSPFADGVPVSIIHRSSWWFLRRKANRPSAPCQGQDDSDRTAPARWIGVDLDCAVMMCCDLRGQGQPKAVVAGGLGIRDSRAGRGKPFKDQPFGPGWKAWSVV